MQGEDHASVCTQRDHMQAKAVPWVINTVVGGECVCVCVCVCVHTGSWPVCYQSE